MKNSFGKVGVFCGGTSGERDISLQTGNAVFEALLGNNVDAELVDVGKDEIIFEKYDVAFVALHGRDGEDGKFQAVLEYHDIPYTGSNVEASSLSMNKWHTKAVWESMGIATPGYSVVRKNNGLQYKETGLPVYVKPVNEGSSIGIAYVDSSDDLDYAITEAARYDNFILIENAIPGSEYTYSYLQGCEDLPLIKLEPAVGFYDFEAKYARDDTKYIVDPELDADLTGLYKKQAKTAFHVLGMSGWGRVDFIVDDVGKAWFIEANSVPGMTSHSLVPMAAKNAGIEFDELCLLILGTAYDEK